MANTKWQAIDGPDLSLFGFALFMKQVFDIAICEFIMFHVCDLVTSTSCIFRIHELRIRVFANRNLKLDFCNLYRVSVI